MKKKLLSLLIPILAILGSCETNEMQMSSVSGTVTLYDANNRSIISPIEGVKIFLFDGDYMPDTVIMEGYKFAIIDSVLTNTEGFYQFINLAPGNYAVTPDPAAPEDYRFQLTEDSGPFQFTFDNNNRQQNIHFTSPVPEAENAGEIKITLRLLHFPQDKKFDIRVRQKTWTLFIFEGHNTIMQEDGWIPQSNEKQYIVYGDKGWDVGYSSLLNTFILRLKRHDCDEILPGIESCNYVYAQSELSLDKHNPPLDIEWIVDYNTLNFSQYN